jgi:hypothetical protein
MWRVGLNLIRRQQKRQGLSNTIFPFTGLNVLKNIHRMDFSVKYGVRSPKFI